MYYIYSILAWTKYKQHSYLPSHLSKCLHVVECIYRQDLFNAPGVNGIQRVNTKIQLETVIKINTLAIQLFIIIMYLVLQCLSVIISSTCLPIIITIHIIQYTIQYHSLTLHINTLYKTLIHIQKVCF